MPITLNTALKDISGVGIAYQKRLEKLGVHTVRDLVYYFPRRYEDVSKVVPIAQLVEGEHASVHGIIKTVSARRGWGRVRFIIEAVIEDESGAIRAVWFNQPYLTKTLKKGVKLSLATKPTRDKKGKLVLSSPEFELLGGNFLHTSRLIPIYSETRGVSSKWLRWKIHTLLPQVLEEVKEFLPVEIIEKYNFPSLRNALPSMHFPKNENEAKKAHKRFAFTNLFLIRLLVLLERLKQKRKKAEPISFDKEFVQALVKSLGVTLTEDQRKAAWDAFKDMAKPFPMQRLLQGDVGTGKTFVALLICALVAKKGKQSVLMAPTEILASQHFATFVSYLSKFEVPVLLMTRSRVEFYDPLVEHVRKLTPAQAKEKITNGEANIIIGTHRVIASGKTGKAHFRNLVLVIVDEQHRFGVKQRAFLVSESGIENKESGSQKRNSLIHTSKFVIPHLLTMSATPIPRSLALTIYGNLDMSFLHEFPQGRRNIETTIVTPKHQEQVFEFIRDRLKQNEQAYFIYPIIEESEKLDTKAALEAYQTLKHKIFKEFEVGLLHGRMKGKEKEEVMQKFLAGQMNVLVATSVVEVGVDVAGASIMVIEGAERFGLAQIHQLRGRIGRRGQAAHCFLFTHTLSGSTRERLKALRESNDGFFLAQKDLEIRGPGQLLGMRQAGIPDVAMESLKDVNLVEAIKKEADTLIEQSANLSQYPLLKGEVIRYGKHVHLE